MDFGLLTANSDLKCVKRFCVFILDGLSCEVRNFFEKIYSLMDASNA